MPDWRGAVAYPFRGPQRERPFLAVWISLLLAGAVPTIRYVGLLGGLASLLVLLPTVGYLVRLLVASEAGEPAPGFLTDVGVLLRRGIGGTFVSAVYLWLPFALLAITVYGAIYTDRVPTPNSVSTLTIYAGSTVVLSLSLLGAYLLPIALATYGTTGSFRAAFSPKTLRPVVPRGAYFAGWTAGFAVFGFVTAIAVAVASATRVGTVFAAAIVAYALLLTGHVWGRSLARAR